ncbi:Uncharacterised protein [Serratia fonticola]|uniref:transcriptional antitermination N peptide n=1 Tax=Serratia fonticola TaxID=47917 RepID=UPI0021792D75|nr:hypothetical protein [Serratia fonticola]CAI1767427.1 Uncharacterised protein [Serratia fonticola]
MKCYAYDNADKRRRDRRQALTEAYNREHGIADVEHQPKRPVLSLKKHKPVDRVDKALAFRTVPVVDTLNNCCLPEVALFSVKSGKTKPITAKF